MPYRLTAAALASTLVVAGCSASDTDTTATATATAPPTTESAPHADASPTSKTSADIDVDSEGSPSADAQDAEGTAALGTAAATVEITLPGQWQYEGTYGDGAVPYAVLVDASQAFDLSEPGSAAYDDSVWVQVETYRVGADAPFADAVADNPADLAGQLADAHGGDAQEVDGRDVPLVYATYEQDGASVDDLYALHGDVWILARPSNVDVDGYLDGDDVDGILTAVLEKATIL
ncbi:hypothetical protein [Demequina globuliformis]|uniref:hypothetical protein n=1 Tax=Demequina globuliformis TaxID=676202 RepID=UPI000782184B|nr:hypothetical protein [Demequina globuliformis]